MLLGYSQSHHTYHDSYRQQHSHRVIALLSERLCDNYFTVLALPFIVTLSPPLGVPVNRQAATLPTVNLFSLPSSPLTLSVA